MAKRLDKFTNAFQQSRIPFLLVEVITDGQGTMVDLACRFANRAAASLLQLPVEDLQGQRFTRRFLPRRLAELKPLETVAFSGSTASFSYNTVLGQTLSVTCYQAMYGMVCCILEPVRECGQDPDTLPSETLPCASAVIELGRGGVRCLSFNQKLCALTGWNRTELLNQFAEDFSALVDQEDWPELLQILLDAARDGRLVDHEFRLRRKDAAPLWVDLRAEILPLGVGSYRLHALFLDIDRRRRSQEQAAASFQQLTAAQDQLSALFNGLPSGYCLLRGEAAGGPLFPLFINQGLSQLLGLSMPELAQGLASDPLWLLSSGNREALSAAADQARNTGVPLRYPCQLHPQDRTLFVTLEVVWQPQADGSYLICAACFDRTADLRSHTELQFRAQLCDLLLDRSRILSFDYDPVSDTMRIDRHNDTGHRITHIIEHYRTALSGTTFVHPEDQKKLSAAVKRLSSRSGAETLEYRGDYDGQGWRWYRLSWISLFDGQGNVTRLLGKGEDISQSKAAALRFHTLVSRQKKLAPGVLASARLDLAKDRILDAKGSSRHLTQVLFGNTADACLRHLRDNVPNEAQRQQFDALFRRDTLLAAFHQGETVFSLEHRFLASDGVPVWANTSVELAEDPDTLHITAFCTVSGIDGQRYQSAVLDILARRGYDFVLAVNSASGVCQMYGGQAPLPAGTTYRSLAAKYLWNQAPSHQRTAIRRAVRLETIRDVLQNQDTYSYTCVLDTPDGPQCKQFTCSWLDREAGVLLVTLGGL